VKTVGDGITILIYEPWARGLGVGLLNGKEKV
jgi:hypothetical protein